MFCVSKNFAFTLSEVLITLAVIGVVSVLTIPPLIKNHHETAWKNAQKVFVNRLEVATRQMNTEEKLAGYNSTMDFVNELKKYIKITRVCDNDEITKCFDKEIIWSEGEDSIDMSTIKTAESFGLEWGTDTVAVQFANGINAVIAYNPNTTQEPYNNQFNATSSSMAILYDVSGNKNPNTNGKDIEKINVSQLAGVAGCMIPELKETMCITQILAPNTGYTPLTKEQCEEIAEQGYGNRKGFCGDLDYWAGAVKICGGTSYMPDQAQLITLAKYIYPDAVSISGSAVTDANWNPERIVLFAGKIPNGNSGFAIWGREASASQYVSNRTFNPTYTYGYNLAPETNNRLAICVDE